MTTVTSRPDLGPDVSKPDYGSVEFYKQYFDDILADVGTSNSAAENIEVALVVLEAFEASINEWMTYHQSCAESYVTMLDKFMYGKTLDRT
tara:strand:- start:2381 stop:2653 length:273 start_codon:yes stop_codon:yes gene_type:complete